MKPPHPGSLVAFAHRRLWSRAASSRSASVDGGTPRFSSIGPYLGRVLAFSLVQAALSTLLSLVLGIGLALALARRRISRARASCWPRSAPTMVMPTIVAVFAVLSVYGRNGWLAEALRLARLDRRVQHLRISRHPHRPCVSQRALRGADHARRARQPCRPNNGASPRSLGLHARPDLPASRLAGPARGTSGARRA